MRVRVRVRVRVSGGPHRAEGSEAPLAQRAEAVDVEADGDEEAEQRRESLVRRQALDRALHRREEEVRRRGGGDGPRREEDKGQGEGEADKGVREDIPLEPRAAALAQQRLEPLLRARALEAAVETHHVGEHEVERVHEREGKVGGRQPVRSGDKEGES